MSRIAHRAWEVVWAGILNVGSKHPSSAELSIAGVVAAGIVLFAHGGVLQNFFLGDDGHFLDLVTRYSVIDYFFKPAVTAAVSGGAFAPWNAVPYSINLGLFGFEPKGYYAHQLVVLWLTAVATCALLRCYVGLPESLAGVALFLAGAPTVHVANELMTGHYAYGLLFAIVGVLCFVRALRGGRWPWVLAGTCLYFLAAVCKEIYVPLPLVLVFLPEGNLLQRIRYASACIVPGIGYLAWRWLVIGSFSGWKGGGWNSWVQPEGLHNVTAQIGHLPVVMFGTGPAAATAMIAMLLLLAIGMWRRPAGIGLVIAALVAILMPMVPLMARELVQTPDRYCYALWWGLSVGSGIMAGRGRTAYAAHPLAIRFAGFAAMAAMIASMWWGQSAYLDLYFSSSRHIQAVYRATLRLGADERIVIPWDETRWMNHLLNGAARALDRYRGQPGNRDTVLERPSEVELIRQGRLRGLIWDPLQRAVVPFQDLPMSRQVELLAAVLKQEIHHQVHVMRPPYQPRIGRWQFDGEKGNVDRIVTQGSVVSVHGWAPTEDELNRRIAHIGVPYAPETTAVSVQVRPDVAAALSDPKLIDCGFLVRMTFQTPQQAVQAAASTCLVFQGSDEKLLLVRNPFNGLCRSLVR